MGWSGVPEEMNIINPRYLNGLSLGGKNVGRPSFTGGGRQFRITTGVNPFKPRRGAQHFYVPRTFVPNSIANPLKVN